MKFTKTSNLLASKALLLLSCSSLFAELPVVRPEEVGFDSDKLSAIVDRADSVYEAGLLPNYVISLAKDGKVFFTASRGNRTIGTDKPVGMDTLFPLASMSKPIASSAIFHLVEQGKLSLDSNLSDFYPQFENMLVAENGSLDAQFEDISRPITILDLLTHTAGIEYRTAIGGTTDVAELYEEIGLIDACLTAAENMELLAQLPLIAQPGEIWNYSISVDVLGAVVEVVTGMSLGNYVAENLFAPIGIHNSAWRHSDQMLNEKFATLYTPPINGQIAIGRLGAGQIDWRLAPSERYSACPVGSQVREFDMGGSGLVGTATDYLVYAMMIANLGEFDNVRVLSEDSVKAQTTQQVPAAGNMPRQDRLFGAGFGIAIDPDIPDEADYFSWGGSNNTGFFVDPKDGTVGVQMSSCYRCAQALIPDIEQIVDEARLEQD
jgi:CubicO group peptidase (beta-lactamase class C family)